MTNDNTEKIKALQNTINHWTWLAETGSSSKYNWPGIKVPLGRNPKHDCFCCEFTAPHPCASVNCDRCPLKSFWKEQGCLSTRIACEDVNSPYQVWKDAENVEQRKFFARQMVEGARKELAKLQNIPIHVVSVVTTITYSDGRQSTHNLPLLPVKF